MGIEVRLKLEKLHFLGGGYSEHSRLEVEGRRSEELLPWVAKRTKVAVAGSWFINCETTFIN